VLAAAQLLHARTLSWWNKRQAQLEKRMAARAEKSHPDNGAWVGNYRITPPAFREAHANGKQDQGVRNGAGKAKMDGHGEQGAAAAAAHGGQKPWWNRRG
jgi:hypothetical protein